MFHDNAVELEENEGCEQTCPFVAIDKGMIAHQMEEVGGCLFKQIVMDQVSAKGRLWLSYGRLEQSTITQPRSATKAGKLHCVKLEDIVDCEKLGVHSASLRKVLSCWSMRRPAACCTRAQCTSRTGRTISASPSVLISSLVFLSMFNRSRMGRSMMSPRLFPMVVRVLTMIGCPYKHCSNDSITNHRLSSKEKA